MNTKNYPAHSSQNNKLTSKNRWLGFVYRMDVFLCLVCAAIFLAFPQIDLVVTGWFYNPHTYLFEYGSNSVAFFIYHATNVIAVVVSATLLLALLASVVLCKRILANKRTLVFLLSVALIGSGLVVNLILKDHAGRPRPTQTIEFGGTHQFVPALTLGSCTTCHSFVSGHASVGFWFFAFVLLARKRRWLLAPVLLGGIMGFGRILQGAHFLSDVIFSGWVMWFCACILYYLFFGAPKHSSATEKDPAIPR